MSKKKSDVSDAIVTAPVTVPLPPSELEALPETLPHMPEPPPEYDPYASHPVEAAYDPHEPVKLFEDGEYKVTSRDGLLEMINKAHAPPVEYVPPPRSPGQLARLAEEQAAGRRALGLHEEKKLAEKLPPAEDQGRMIAVERPGDFREYQPMTAPARNKQIG